MSALQPAAQEELAALLDSLEIALLNLENGSPQATVTGLRLLVRAAQLLGSFTHLPEVQRLQQEIQHLIAQPETLHPQHVRQALQEAHQVLEALAQQLPGLQVRLLIVEPDDGLADLLTTMLQTAYRDISVVHTADEAKQFLEKTPVHLIITELLLPDLDGRSLLLWIRRHPPTAQTPILILSDRISSAVKAECYALGADDVLEKPFDPAEVSLVVASMLQRAMVRHPGDPLTGLPGRAYLEETFARLVQLHRQTGSPFCVACIELDNLTALNQRYGQHVSDEVIRQTAWQLVRMLRAGDILGRWDTDTFCILLPDASETQARMLLEQALEALQTEPMLVDTNAPPVSFSACIVPIGQTAPPSLATLIQQAQQCLKKGDKGGKIYSLRANIDTQPHILLVEDDPAIATLIQIRLQRDGYKVTHFANGREAAEWAQTHIADLVILDVKLPGMDGFELLAHLRQLPSYSAVPIMMLTSLSQEQHIVRGFELGADDYIVKPFSPVELSARVRRLLQRQAPQLAVV
ncbi:MAG: response regulator [Rhodothermus sp.]|nr:response regulator [Rhodothermus sp.]